MSFVGTRPEVPKYVRQYTPEMFATLLLPAGMICMSTQKRKFRTGLIRQKEKGDLLSVIL